MNMDFEVLEYYWALGFLAHKINPFRTEIFANHYIRMPIIKDDQEFEKLENDFMKLILGIGWEFKQVVVFKTRKTKKRFMLGM